MQNGFSLSDIIDKVHSSMKYCKLILTIREKQLNITPLIPVIYNNTRYLGKYLVIRRFLKILDELFQTSYGLDGFFSVPRTP